MFPNQASNVSGRLAARSISGWTRWLHIYLSMGSFFILFFFAVTGLTLNHTEWFEQQQQTTNLKGQLKAAWVATRDTAAVARLEIVEYLRKAHAVKGALNEFITDESQCTVSFTGPGYAADIFIDRTDGSYDFSETRTGVFGVLNDLHKGRDSGKAWGWLIDISAILMVLVSLTGLMMLFFLKKKRMAGILVALAGLLIVYLVYLAWVP
jgi:hypothetical protein